MMASVRQDVIRCKAYSVWATIAADPNEKVPDQPLLGLGVSLEAPWIEEAVIHTVPYIHTIFIIQIICYLLEDHSEEDAEESRCMYTTLVQAVGDRNELR